MAEPSPDRASDIASKQEALSGLLREQDREGLLLLDPANFSWFTGGASVRGVLDPPDHPALFVQNSHRWLICSNVDTQRIFDQELDGLGFQLKEWPWQWGRGQLLADLCHGKRLACDVVFGECHHVGDYLRNLRRALSPWEQIRLREAGRIVAHAVEATCRHIELGDSEEEVAGQVAHRLLHRGLEPVAIEVAADGGLRKYRRYGPTSRKVERTCMIQATARRCGLHVVASRAVSFGAPDELFRAEIETACRWSAVSIASSVAGARPAGILQIGIQFLERAGIEHEWRFAPIGWVTGHAAKEATLLPNDVSHELAAGWVLVWQASVGAVTNADTVLVTEQGPEIVTPSDLWPLKRIKVGAVTVDRPDLLVRTA